MRSEEPGPGFTWRGKLRLGSSLEEALKVLPLPSKTVVGKPLGFAENVLYKSAYKTPDGALIINPPEFIRLVKAHRS